MAQFPSWDIQELPLCAPLFRRKVERFLAGNGLRLEQMDVYYAIEDASGELVAGGGLRKDIIQCVAVSESARSAGLAAPLVSRLIAEGTARGYDCLKVFTKPGNRAIFESLGFHLLAAAPKAILMENGKGLEKYCHQLRSLAGEENGRTGVAVLHANPVTLGHRYLLEKAAQGCDRFFVIPLSSDDSRFSLEERSAMLRAVLPANASLCPASDYVISHATFPSYFLKDLSEAAETQMRLDLDLFARHIMPALGASVRFVGSEPHDRMTARYNTLMKDILPEVEIIPRLKAPNGRFITGRRVREFLDEGRYSKAAALTPVSTHPYLMADLAARAIRVELDAPLKPGLVGPDGPGAHTDMDYALMLRGIAAIRPWLGRMALADSPAGLKQLGIDAEKAMLDATGGVNTHRGAIFALGLAISAAVLAAKRKMQETDYKLFMHFAIAKMAHSIIRNQQKTNELHFTPGLRDARGMALDGYKDLFVCWLPFYRSVKGQPLALQRTLLLIMASLDDTCIIKRAGAERAQQVKSEATAWLEGSFRAATPLAANQAEEIGFSECLPKNNFRSRREPSPTAKTELEQLCRKYAAEGISPGGAADMLALTIYFDSITS